MYPGEDDEPHASNINRNSIALLLCVGSYSVLFMGDATVKEEPIILKQLEKYNIQEVHILKVGHHGSSTSTGDELLNKLLRDIYSMRLFLQVQKININFQVQSLRRDGKLLKTIKVATYFILRIT